MDLYGPLLEKALFPAFEAARGRPTVPLLRYLQGTERWSRDQLRDLQTGFLRRLVRHAYAHTSFYRELLDAGLARERFASSALVRRLLPDGLRERALPLFDAQRMISRFHTVSYGGTPPSIDELASALTEQPLRSPILAALATSEPWIDAARRAASLGATDPFVDEILAIDALADRDYGRAAGLFAAAERGDHAAQMRPLRVLALGLAGRVQEARSVLASAPRAVAPHERQERAWLEQNLR